jgi:Flp pilus assembly protein TadB
VAPDGPGAGKGRPTPKRRQAEAANKRPLVPDDRKAAAKAARLDARAKRDREFEALKTGDERYLPAKDRGPARRYIRDHVDARRNLGEFFLPMAVVLLVLQVTLAQVNAGLAVFSLLFLYVFVIAMMVDAFIMWRTLKKRLVAKFGADAIPRGVAMYAVMRVFQLRRSRLPKPQVKHGEYPA